MHALTTLVGCELCCRASMPAGRVTGFVIDARWRVRYVIVRLDAEKRARPRLLPAAAFPPLALPTGPMTACLTPAELSHGLELEGTCEAITRAQEAALHDALHWAPYWRPDEVTPPSSLHDAGAAMGARLTCAGEAFGRVDDLMLDTTRWSVSALRIATGPASWLHLPPAFISDAHWDRAQFDCDVRAAALSCAPTTEQATPGSDYFERLRRHLADTRRMP